MFSSFSVKEIFCAQMQCYKFDRSEWNQRTVILMKRTLLEHLQYVYNTEENLNQLSRSDGATLYATFNGSYGYLGEVLAKIHFYLIYTEYAVKTVLEMITTRDPIAAASESEQLPRTKEEMKTIEEKFLPTKKRMEHLMSLIEEIFWKYIKEELGL
ncbi:hypothetical protein HNY73_011292 [Argiope bruennichi]|uniref:Uncharacterized protein n=1 Tax=Argiope bruennichi TaxID=94029 RepID=A0A8T0F3N6_ARGBR|nr:hypothetical protein HNY73_011292 [Argiope bruennichi]